jgi:hypothetical protein
LSGSDFLGEAARHEFAEHGVKPARDPIPRTAEVAVSSRPDLDDRGLLFRGDGANGAERRAAIATERASFGSFWLT